MMMTLCVFFCLWWKIEQTKFICGLHLQALDNLSREPSSTNGNKQTNKKRRRSLPLKKSYNRHVRKRCNVTCGTNARVAVGWESWIFQRTSTWKVSRLVPEGCNPIWFPSYLLHSQEATVNVWKTFHANHNSTFDWIARNFFFYTLCERSGWLNEFRTI